MAFRAQLGRALTRGIAETVSLLQRGQAPRAGLRVLMYHSVGSRAIGDTRGIYGIAPGLFKQQMTALALHEDLACAALDTPGMAPSRVAITFDDGYRDNLHVAAPILLEHRLPFTVFVCSGFLRDTRGNFLSPAELRELAALPGATIGSHGATHTPLTRLDDAALREELVASKTALEDLTGRCVDAISYPHGAVDRRVRAAAAAAGYALGACSRFDINADDRDPLLLCRTDIHADDGLRVFNQKLDGAWDWYRWRSADPAAGDNGGAHR